MIVACQAARDCEELWDEPWPAWRRDARGGPVRRRRAKLSLKDFEKAYAALAMLHAQLGDYRAEARLLVEQAEQTRLPAKTRAAAVRKARELRKHREGLNGAT